MCKRSSLQTTAERHTEEKQLHDEQKSDNEMSNAKLGTKKYCTGWNRAPVKYNVMHMIVSSLKSMRPCSYRNKIGLTDIPFDTGDFFFVRLATQGMT
jgi:hypothetical protein